MSSARNTVAVVDDDLSVVTALERLLSTQGFATAAFTSAEAFLAHPRRHEVHCLILDVHLVGFSGIDLKRYMTASGWALPTIFITAFDDEAQFAEAMEAGCIAFLRKPFTASVLIDAVNRALTKVS